MSVRKNLIVFYSLFFLFILFLGINAYTNKPANIDNPTLNEYSGQALITFSYDDGLINHYTNALPLHEEYNIPATFNVIASRIYDETFHDLYLDEKMIKEMHEKGFEIAAHGYYHWVPFTKLNISRVQEEFEKTEIILSDIIGSVDTIAIPYSQYNDEIKELAREYYKGARVYGERSNVLDDIDYYWLNSFAVTNKTTFDEIKTIIDQGVKEKSWVIIMLHGVEYENDTLYEITPNLLEEVLMYVNSFDKSDLLPVNTIDGITFTQEFNKH